MLITRFTQETIRRPAAKDANKRLVLKASGGGGTIMANQLQILTSDYRFVLDVQVIVTESRRSHPGPQYTEV